MTVQELMNKGIFHVIHEGDNRMQQISKPFCCDLLSIAMSKAPEHSAWITVMGNMNTLAVAKLADVACIILAEGAAMDQAGLEKAREQNITVLSTDKPIFEAAYTVYQLLHD